jgi:hypothetical protein
MFLIVNVKQLHGASVVVVVVDVLVDVVVVGQIQVVVVVVGTNVVLVVVEAIVVVLVVVQFGETGSMLIK